MNDRMKTKDRLPNSGAAYIRYSSELQSDSFSLDAQLRQITEQAEHDGVEIIKVFSDNAQSAYRHRYRPGINAMREAALRGEFKILYTHKVDRLARRLEWAIEIIKELQEVGIGFKAVQQPFDLNSPEGKLMFHLICSLGEFYSDNLSKETNKGKLERSLQGYHNGTVPWGYNSILCGNRKIGVPDPEKAPVVEAMYENYATGNISDMEIADWLNEQGYITNRNHPFSKDTVRDMLTNMYYTGKISYRGMSVRPCGTSFRSSPRKISKGRHEPIVSEDLWQRCQIVRADRGVNKKIWPKTVHVHLLQGLVVCSACGRRLRIQTPSRGLTYYREESHSRGYYDCVFRGRSVHADIIDPQIDRLIRSIFVPDNWEQLIALGAHDIEAQEVKVEIDGIRKKLRLLRKNFEGGLYEGEDGLYWKKVTTLKDRLWLLEHVPETTLYRAARILLEATKSWDAGTKEERKKYIHLIFREVGCDLEKKTVVWARVRPEYETIINLQSILSVDEDRRYWLVDETRLTMAAAQTV